VATGPGDALDLGELFVYLNGEIVQAGAARISPFDHGLHYGDGVFEGISVYDGKIFQLQEHVSRLIRSCHVLRIPLQLPNSEIVAAIHEVAWANGFQRGGDGYIRPIITRGVGPLGVGSTKDIAAPTVLILAQPRAAYSDQQRAAGLVAMIAATRRTPPESLDPRVKSCNYLNNIMAKFEQWDAGVDLAIMLDQRGFVAEGPGENIGVVRGAQLLTPFPHNTLDGLVRRALLELARARGLQTVEMDLTAYDLFTADEVFVCGTLTEIVGVVQVAGRPIAAGRVGSHTSALHAALRQLIADTSVPIRAPAEVRRSGL
jgi:branched-chain amino acid aminotransferase